MRKQRIAVVAVFAAAMASLAPSAFAFHSVSISTLTAKATTQGSRVANFSFRLVRSTNPTEAVSGSNLTWSNVDPLTTKWKIADIAVVINSTVTDSGGGIEIYTDNTASDAVPQFVDPTPGAPGTPNRKNADSAAAGLLLGTSGTTSSPPLPMAWSIKTATASVENSSSGDGLGAADPNNGSTTGYNNKFQWLFYTDAYDVDGVDFNGDGNVTSPGDAAPFVFGGPFITMINGKNAVHFGQADSEFAGNVRGKDAYVYSEADFETAASQQAYQTTTLRLEAFLQ